MALPEQVATRLADEISLADPPSAFRLRAIDRECRSLIKHATRETLGLLWHVRGLVLARLHDDAASLSAFLNARHYGERSTISAINIGAAHLRLGDTQAAMREFGAVIDKAQGKEAVLLYANMAEALSVLGLVEDANAAFQHALDLANLADPEVVYVLACQAAEIGADRDAAGFFDRFLALTAHPDGRHMPRDLQERLFDMSPPLRRAVEAYRLAAGSGSPTPPADASEWSEDAEEVFRATSGARVRATNAVVGT